MQLLGAEDAGFEQVERIVASDQVLAAELMKVANTALASLGATGISNLTSVGHTFDMERNPQLASLGPTGLTALTSVGANGGIFDFENNPLIASAVFATWKVPVTVWSGLSPDAPRSVSSGLFAITAN